MFAYSMSSNNERKKNSLNSDSLILLASALKPEKLVREWNQLAK